MRFVPETFLGRALPAAWEKRDPMGRSIRAFRKTVTEEFQAVPMMYVGIYRVEIEHPALRPRGETAGL